MNEIEKMYENAGIEKQGGCPHACVAIPYHDCKNCKYKDDIHWFYPFTAEKQISLIKFLMKQEDFSWTIAQQGKDTKYVFYVGYEYGSGDFKEFAESIAGIINDLWSMQSLTEEEKEQIREILK